MPYKDPDDPRKKQVALRSSAKYYANNKKKVLQATYKNKREYRAKWIAFKATLKCAFCGENHPATLDFHHSDRTKKDNEVSTYTRQHQYARAMEEVKKCIVLCANCHRILHYKERMGLLKKKKPHRSGA